VTVVEIPQWQGSGSRLARRLVLGAALLGEAITADGRHRVAVGNELGETRGGVRHADVLADNLAAIRTALPGSPAVTVGGDCGVELAPIEAAVQRHGDRLAVVWFDAHGDLNTPGSSPSGAFHGMVLRTLLGEGPAALAPAEPLSPSQVVLAGVRALDPAERDYIDGHGIPIVTAQDPAALVAAVQATGASAVYVHIDLDVLDPATFSSLGYPEPGGLSPGQLRSAVLALAERIPLAGLGITEYQPANPADQETLARLLPPLASLIR
jgi:arginase